LFAQNHSRRKLVFFFSFALIIKIKLRKRKAEATNYVSLLENIFDYLLVNFINSILKQFIGIQ